MKKVVVLLSLVLIAVSIAVTFLDQDYLEGSKEFKTVPSFVIGKPSVYQDAEQQFVIDAPAPPPQAPVTGAETIIAILIEFPDKEHDEISTPTYFGELLYSKNETANSMHNYYKEVSYEQLTIVGNVTTVWYMAENDLPYYGYDEFAQPPEPDGWGDARDLVREAVLAADDEIDFSMFDKKDPNDINGNGNYNEPDGWVDHLCIIHAGEGQESSDDPNDIWSHRWAIEPLEVDGVNVSGYVMLSEFSPLGTFAHEFGHDLGLPDLYDIDYSSDGIGYWGLMSLGSWNNNGDTPAHPCAWSKMKLGWIEPTEIKDTVMGLSVPQIETEKVVYKLSILNSTTEYFLIENRQRVGYDSYLPGSGILIWHIDDAMRSNADDNHRLVDLEEADEGVNGDSPHQQTDPWFEGNDLMPSEGFRNTSIPNSNAYDGRDSGWVVNNFSSSGIEMSIDVRVVDDDVAVLEIDLPLFSQTYQVFSINATIGNLRHNPQSNFNVSCTAFNEDGNPVFYEEKSITFLNAYDSTYLIWEWKPKLTGTYLVEVRTLLSFDDVPGNDWLNRTVQITEIIFFDDVEHGINGWTHSGEGIGGIDLWHQTEDESHSPQTSWYCGFITGYYLPAVNNSLYSPTIDLSSATTAWLIFYHQYDLRNILGFYADVGYLEIKVGDDWAELTQYTGTQGSWEMAVFDISNYTGNEIKIRYRLVSNALLRGAGWYVDDIAIIGEVKGFGVELNVVGSSHRSIKILESASYNISIRNLGNVEDTYNIYFNGPEGLEIYSNMNPITLDPFETKIFEVTVDSTIDPPGDKPSNIRIFARSIFNQIYFDDVTVTIFVDQDYGIEFTPVTQTYLERGPGETAEFRFSIENIGNGVDTLTFSLASGQHNDWARFVSKMDLYPGDEEIFILYVDVPSNAIYNEEAHITVTMYSENGDLYILNRTITLVKRVYNGVSLECSTPFASLNPGESHTFTIIVKNLDNGDSTVHLSLSGINAGWGSLESSVFGMNAFETRNVELRVTAPSNALVSEYAEILVKGKSESGGEEGSVEITVSVNEVYGLALKFENEFSTLYPGQEAKYSIEIKNNGNSDESFSLTAYCKYQEWLYLSDDTVTIKGFSSKYITLIIKVPENATFGESITIFINASSEFASDSINTTALIYQHYELSISCILSDQNSLPGDKLEFILKVRNLGDGEDTVTLSIEGLEWTYVLEYSTFTLGPSGEERITLEITIPSDAEIGEHAFTVRCQSENETVFNSTSLSITVQRPDIYIKEIKFSKENPREGEKINITVVIENIGNYNAFSITVEFYSGSEIIDELSIPVLQAKNETELTITWKAKKGEHTIIVSAYPENKEIESDLGNNEISKTITVKEKEEESVLSSLKSLMEFPNLIYVILLTALAVVIIVAVILVRRRKRYTFEDVFEEEMFVELDED